jgi:hypothetical protein
MTNATLRALLDIYGTILRAGWGESPGDANEQETLRSGGLVHVEEIVVAGNPSGEDVLMKTNNPQSRGTKPGSGLTLKPLGEMVSIDED